MGFRFKFLKILEKFKKEIKSFLMKKLDVGKEKV